MTAHDFATEPSRSSGRFAQRAQRRRLTDGEQVRLAVLHTLAALRVLPRQRVDTVNRSSRRIAERVEHSSLRLKTS